ncbi:MAG TPA: hypothetical protein VG674_26945 [Amycolatopsis sp.]|jgi:hypothetical protein|nr:hypothetical protein [Amycolatopsis sp.]
MALRGVFHSVFLDGELIVAIEGAFDGVAPDYHRVTEDAFAHGATCVVVDLTRTTAAGAGGYAALAATAASCAARAVRFVLSLPGGIEGEITDPEQIRPMLGDVETWRDSG